MLVKIHNDAGVTAALKVTGPQIVAPGTKDGWLEVSVVTEAPFAAKLGGGYGLGIIYAGAMFGGHGG